MSIWTHLKKNIGSSLGDVIKVAVPVVGAAVGLLAGGPVGLAIGTKVGLDVSHGVEQVVSGNALHVSDYLNLAGDAAASVPFASNAAEVLQHPAQVFSDLGSVGAPTAANMLPALSTISGNTSSPQMTSPPILGSPAVGGINYGQFDANQQARVNAAQQTMNAAIQQAGGAVDSAYNQQQGYYGGAKNSAIQNIQDALSSAQKYQQPYYDAGGQALQLQRQLLGLDKSVDPLTALRNTPGYQFQVSDAMGNLQRTMAARGLGGSTAESNDMLRTIQGLADQTYNQTFQNATQLSGQGQGAANQLSGNQMQAGQNLSGINQNFGQLQGNAANDYGLSKANIAMYGGASNAGYQMMQPNYPINFGTGSSGIGGVAPTGNAGVDAFLQKYNMAGNVLSSANQVYNQGQQAYNNFVKPFLQ